MFFKKINCQFCDKYHQKLKKKRKFTKIVILIELYN